jgi:hypothetical protein
MGPAGACQPMTWPVIARSDNKGRKWCDFPPVDPVVAVLRRRA